MTCLSQEALYSASSLLLSLWTPPGEGEERLAPAEQGTVGGENLTGKEETTGVRDELTVCAAGTLSNAKLSLYVGGGDGTNKGSISGTLNNSRFPINSCEKVHSIRSNTSTSSIRVLTIRVARESHIF